jgi:hypothetical protein
MQRFLLRWVGTSARIPFSNWAVIGAGAVKKIQKGTEFLLTIWSNEHIM